MRNFLFSCVGDALNIIYIYITIYIYNIIESSFPYHHARDCTIKFMFVLVCLAGAGRLEFLCFSIASHDVELFASGPCVLKCSQLVHSIGFHRFPNVSNVVGINGYKNHQCRSRYAGLLDLLEKD